MRPYRLALACALAPLFGCSLLKQVAASNFQKPGLTFKDAKLSAVSLEGATVDLTFFVDNPNEQGISLAETDYQLKIEGHQLVAGKPPAGLTIPAHGKGEVTLPAAVKFSELGASVAALLSKKTVAYDAGGHIGVDTPIGRVGLPFSKQGTLDLPRVPEISVGSPSLKDLSLGAATLVLPLTLSNPNGFALPLGMLAGKLQVAGAEVGSVQSKDVGALPASGKQTVALPLRIRFSDAYAAFKALQQGSAHINFKGELRSGDAALPFEIDKDVNVSQGSGNQADEPTQTEPQQPQQGSGGDGSPR